MKIPDPWKLLAWLGDLAALSAVSLAVWCVSQIHDLKTDVEALKVTRPTVDQLPPRWYVETVNARFATVDQRFDILQKMVDQRLESIQKTLDHNAGILEQHMEKH